MKFLVFICTIFSIFFAAECGLNVETLRYCCGLGSNYANSGLNCDSFQPPIAGIEPQDEKLCINSVGVCCRNQYQEIQCDQGIQLAKNNEECLNFDNMFTKDCCEACGLGIGAAKSQASCNDNPGLGPPYDSAFTGCCRNYSLSTTTSTTTTTTTETTPTTNEHSSITTPKNDDSALPAIENVCDIGDVCAQICLPTDNSYKCACNKGFTLMSDGISCKPDKRSPKKNDRCAINNPCEHDCVDTGVAIKCTCRDGYELAKDKTSCKDIDECALGVHECEPNEVCINDEGFYYCEDPNYELDKDLNTDNFESKCPAGFKFNYEKMVCDDIDECEFDIICPRPKTCVNTIGSFKCEGDDRPQCPPGFRYKPAIDNCADIDECITGENDCNKESQTCLNTVGNYTCIDKVSKKTCPPGFKKNPLTQNCDDIDECEENDNLCSPNEQCVNQPGGHSCVPKTSNKVNPYPLPPPPEPPLPKKPSDETTKPTSTTTTTTTTTTTSTTTTESPKTTHISCQRGFRYNPLTHKCDDVNECLEDEQACDSTQNCYNNPGSYTCNCKTGFQKDFQTGACIDINECQVGAHDCTVAQRCDNTIGSYLCARITGCGTGYTLNYASGLCEDDDECALGTHQCKTLGPNFKCRNTIGSYRCDVIKPTSIPASPQIPTQIYFRPRPRPAIQPSRIPPTTLRPILTTPYRVLSGTLKRCLPGYQMSIRGTCEDVDECQSNPCGLRQKCLNFNGGYECVPALQCKIGYEADEAGENCVDVNECSRGTHKCKPTQICKNGQGYYTCECPPGHHLNPVTQACEDIDECKYYRACSENAECMNTIGSYKCRCKDGFRESGNFCEDIDECKETSRLCDHTCVNIWGSYRCACKPGFTLNFDNRTCTDVDECTKFKDTKLCVGQCENIPGSYRCTCPDGYRLGSEGRTCIDIDECAQHICPRHDDICLNTRGGYKCFTITCPSNYIRDPQHKGRCKRPQTLCDPRDIQCILMPEQYTYHYITLVSNLPIADDNIQFFQINGPRWAISRAEFSMKVVNVKCPYGIQPVNERFFRMIKPGGNIMKLYLVRSITGPQEIELKVEMHLFQGNAMISNVVSYIYIVVSQYPF